MLSNNIDSSLCGHIRNDSRWGPRTEKRNLESCTEGKSRVPSVQSLGSGLQPILSTVKQLSFNLRQSNRSSKNTLQSEMLTVERDILQKVHEIEELKSIS